MEAGTQNKYTVRQKNAPLFLCHNFIKLTSSMHFLAKNYLNVFVTNGVKILPLLTKHFFSTKFNKRVKIVQQIDLKL